MFFDQLYFISTLFLFLSRHSQMYMNIFVQLYKYGWYPVQMSVNIDIWETYKVWYS